MPHFSQIRLLQFTDQDFPVATPTFGGCMQYLCSQLQQCHAELLASKPKCFCSGTNFVSRAFWVSFVGAHQLCDPSRRCSPHNPWPPQIWKHLLETTIESHVALEVNTVVYKSGIAIVLFQEHTVDSWAIYPKSFEELNFVAWDEFTKTAKLYALKIWRYTVYSSLPD